MGAQHSVCEICEAMTAQERAVILDCGREFAKFPRAMGILAINSCRNRFKVIEAEDAERGIWRYRLTELGLQVQGELLGVSHRP